MLEALLKKKNQDGRFRYLYWVVIAIFIILVSRLVYLQLFAGEYYHSLAEGTACGPSPLRPCAASCMTATVRSWSAPDRASWRLMYRRRAA